MAGPATTMESASGIAVDAGGTIYVSDHAEHSKSGRILAFASGASGNVRPLSSVGGPHTRLRAPFGLAIDAERIYAVDDGGD